MAYTQYYPNSQLLHASITQIMGTRIDMLLLGRAEVELKSCMKAVKQELVRLHHMLNIFDSGSELAQLNAQAYHQAFIPSAELYHIIQDAARYAPATGGLFDVTLSHIADLIINTQQGSVQFAHPHMRLDLGGYAKGLALKNIAPILQEYGLTQALISLGDSSILALGHHPHGDHWPLSIAHPKDKTRLLGRLRMKDCCASISGNTPANQGHIFDPIKKQAVETARLTAILSPDPILAEVLSTSLMIADSEQAEAICAAFPVIEKQIYEI